MAKNSVIHARIDSALKADVDQILKDLGLSASELINMLYAQVKLTKGIPFDVKLPNEESKRALKNVREGNVTEYDTLEEMIEDAETW